MKTEKRFIAGIKTFRTTIELNDKMGTIIKVDSWSRLKSIDTAKLISETLNLK